MKLEAKSSQKASKKLHINCWLIVTSQHSIMLSNLYWSLHTHQKSYSLGEKILKILRLNNPCAFSYEKARYNLTVDRGVLFIEVYSFKSAIQSCLTISKMRQFQTIKLSQLDKEKTCSTENCQAEQLLRAVSFYVFWGKNQFLIKNFVASA